MVSLQRGRKSLKNVNIGSWIFILFSADTLAHLFAKCLFALFSKFTGSVRFGCLCGEL